MQSLVQRERDSTELTERSPMEGGDDEVKASPSQPNAAFPSIPLCPASTSPKDLLLVKVSHG
jgi:hypothetical protein